jgi:hypothetical protein
MVVSFWWRTFLTWEFLAQLEIGTFGGLFQGVGWCVVNFFIPNIWQFNIVLGVIFFTLYRWWNSTSSVNAKGLNSCRDSCVGITKVDICVAWVVHLHLCLLSCAYGLLTCWLGCHMPLRGKGITKVCAIQLQLGGEHMLSSWPLSSVCLLFSVKL